MWLPSEPQFEKEVTRCIKVMEELESVIARKKGVSQQVMAMGGSVIARKKGVSQQVMAMGGSYFSVPLGFPAPNQ